jgi:uncharacterized protein
LGVQAGETQIMSVEPIAISPPTSAPGQGLAPLPEQGPVDETLVPRRTEGLYRGTVEGMPYVWNPRGMDALAVLNPSSVAILDACDGQKPLSKIRAAVRVPREPFDNVIRRHFKNGFLVADGVKSGVVTLRSAELPPRKLAFWMHVTNGCNFDCPYCYIAKDGTPMEDTIAEQFADRIVASFSGAEGDGPRLQGVEVKLAGGEPLLRWKWMREYIPRVTERVAQAGGSIRFAILTNGALVTPEIAAWLKANKVSTSVSLDGVGAVHDKVRPSLGGKATFNDVVRGLDNLQNVNHRPYVLCTIGDPNLHGLPDLARYIVSRNLGFRISLERDLDNGGRIKASDEEVIRVLNAAYDHVEEALPCTPSFRETHRLCDLALRHPIRKACGAGENYAAIGVNGVLSPCQAGLHQTGTAKLDPTRPLVHQVQGLVQFRGLRRDDPNSECLGCSYRWSCAGGCPLLQTKLGGHANGQSAYCLVFKAMIPRLIQLSAKELLRKAQAAGVIKPTN